MFGFFKEDSEKGELWWWEGLGLFDTIFFRGKYFGF